MRGFNDGRESLHSNNGNIVPRKVGHEEGKTRVASAKRTVWSSTAFIPEFRKRSHAWVIQPSSLLYTSIKMSNIYKFLFFCEHLQNHILGALVSTVISSLLLKVFFSNFQGHRLFFNNNGIYLSSYRRCWFSKTLSYATHAWLPCTFDHGAMVVIPTDFCIY